MKQKRYFHVSYVFNNGHGSAQIETSAGCFFNQKNFHEHQKKVLGEGVTITGIFEFQSEQDYLDFLSK